MSGLIDMLSEIQVSEEAIDAVSSEAKSVGLNWLQMESGAPLNLRGPISPVTVTDVANQLAKICRFGGATREFYSVAQHSVVVSEIVLDVTRNARLAFWALMHDDHELVTGDIPSPAKRLMELGKIERIQTKASYRLRAGLGLPPNGPTLADQKIITSADMMALALEQRDLMAPAQRSWSGLHEPLSHRIIPMKWRDASEYFIAQYEMLEPSVRHA